MRVLRHQLVHLRDEVRFRDRLAELLGSDFRRECHNSHGHLTWDDKDRSQMRKVRCTSGAFV